MARQAITIAGTLVGAAFGMPQLGFALGSMIGNAVDPVQIQGPKIGELQVQTSRDGVPRPIIFGVACVSGNIIDRSEPKIVKKKERQGKGGPEVVTERVYQSFAIRICEGEIQGISKVWENEKLIYDGGDTENFPIPDTGIGKFLGGVSALKGRIGASIYFGGEEQMPDPTFEAIHGVGNCPAYRGTAYIVFKDKDLTDFGGAIPQYRFEVNGPIGLVDSLGEVTHSITLSGYNPGSDIFKASENSIGSYESSDGYLSIGETLTKKVYQSGTLTAASTETITQATEKPGDTRMAMITGDGFGQYIGRGDSGEIKVFEDGYYQGRIKPLSSDSESWDYIIFGPEDHSERTWIYNNNIWMFIRGTDYVTDRLAFWNYIPINDVGANAATKFTDCAFTTPINVLAHLSSDDRFYLLDKGTGILYEWDYGLEVLSAIQTFSIGSAVVRGFGIIGNITMMLLTDGGTPFLRVFRTSDGAFMQNVSGVTAGAYNTKIICTKDSVYVKNGLSLKRIELIYA